MDRMTSPLSGNGSCSLAIPRDHRRHHSGQLELSSAGFPERNILTPKRREGDSQSKYSGPVLQQIDLPVRNIYEYYSLIQADLGEELDRLAGRLRGLKVGHVNATSAGGGVAELLRSVVPLANSLGVEMEWHCLGPHPEYFQITKNIHNSLQGGTWSFDGRAHRVFLNYVHEVAQELTHVDVDLLIIHDPQPCLLIKTLPGLRRAIWHCHIDTSTPNSSVWNYFAKFAQAYDRLIFCLPEYVNGALPGDGITFIQPAIDPLVPKNQLLSRPKAKEILGGLGIDPERPVISQVARFDPWKDPHGVIDAYRLAKRKIPTLQLALVGVLAAQDDPEAEVILRQVQSYQGGDPDIHLFTDPEQIGELEVNAFQTGSDVILQKSLREGFGLTVAEALWKGTPVIGGNCGGIRLQIKEGENGYLVNSVEECAQYIVQLLRNEELRVRMGAKGQETVQAHFLVPRLLRDYLRLAEEVVLGG